MDEARARKLLDGEVARVRRLMSEVRDGGGCAASESDSGSELSHYDQHQADVGTETFEREKDLAILESLERELAELEAALRRVDAGTYGRCEACGEEITPERLEVHPAARFCTEHEPRRRERR